MRAANSFRLKHIIENLQSVSLLREMTVKMCLLLALLACSPAVLAIGGDELAALLSSLSATS